MALGLKFGLKGLQEANDMTKLLTPKILCLNMVARKSTSFSRGVIKAEVSRRGHFPSHVAECEQLRTMHVSLEYKERIGIFTFQLNLLQLSHSQQVLLFSPL